MQSSNHRSDILFAFFVAILLLVAWNLRQVLLIIYIAALFAVVIGPAIGFVQKLRIKNWSPNRGVAVLLIIAAGLVCISAFFLFALPPIFNDLQGFAHDLPTKLQRLYTRVQHVPFLEGIDAERLEQHAASALGGAVGVAAGVAGGLVGFFTWLILMIYFILDGERAFHWFLSLWPAVKRPHLRETALRAEQRMSKWLLGQAMLMLILGVLATIAFGLMHVKYSFALGVFCGLANIVPIIGPVVSVGLAAVVALFDSWTKAVGVVAFYLVYQQLENAWLTPKIMKSTVDLPALAVIVALTVGGALAGVLGALIAVPTAALLAVVIDEYVIKKNDAEIA